MAKRKPKTFKDIRPGSQVTILVPSGKGLERVYEKEDGTPLPRMHFREVQRYTTVTGRAVMPSSDGGWVLNLGGAHGTPGLAYPDNLVRVGG